jgi:hypothetical protein
VTGVGCGSGTPVAAEDGTTAERQGRASPCRFARAERRIVWILRLEDPDGQHRPPTLGAPAVLEDLCAYLSGTDRSPLVQAAPIHARFENLHPLADGNGRTGRALLHLVLRRRGICRRFVPPIRLVLAT